jgi:hypothetical protein
MGDDEFHPRILMVDPRFEIEQMIKSGEIRIIDYCTGTVTVINVKTGGKTVIPVPIPLDRAREAIQNINAGVNVLVNTGNIKGYDKLQTYTNKMIITELNKLNPQPVPPFSPVKKLK